LTDPASLLCDDAVLSDGKDLGGQPGEEAGTVRLDFAPVDIWIHASSSIERRWRAAPSEKEPWTVAWIEQYVKPGDVLYDIGANVGTFSLIAAKYRQAHVVAFEPGYATFHKLCDNIQLNGCQHSIAPIPLPLSDASGLVTFKYRSNEPGQSRHALRETRWRFRHTTTAEAGAHYEQPVCTISLDTAISQFGLPEPVHVKLDVDGTEDRVLAGAAKTLRSRQLRSLMVEIDRGHWDAVVQLLQRAGFTLAERYTHGKEESPAYGLFLRSP
jgi:FkbM family methyltransferase